MRYFHDKYDREKFYSARERFEGGKCFFCGKDNIGIHYCLTKKGIALQSIPIWKRAYNFCREHQDFDARRAIWLDRFINIAGTYNEIKRVDT